MTIARTLHSQTRMAQRGISPADIAFVRDYGRLTHKTGVQFYFLGRRDIPDAMRRAFGHLEGTTLIVAADGRVMVTCYRDRTAIAEIKRKDKRARRRAA